MHERTKSTAERVRPTSPMDTTTGPFAAHVLSTAAQQRWGCTDTVMLTPYSCSYDCGMLLIVSSVPCNDPPRSMVVLSNTIMGNTALVDKDSDGPNVSTLSRIMGFSAFVDTKKIQDSYDNGTVCWSDYSLPPRKEPRWFGDGPPRIPLVNGKKVYIHQYDFVTDRFTGEFLNKLRRRLLGDAPYTKKYISGLGEEQSVAPDGMSYELAGYTSNCIEFDSATSGVPPEEYVRPNALTALMQNIPPDKITQEVLEGIVQDYKYYFRLCKNAGL